MVVFLKAIGPTLDRKRVQRLMRQMGVGWHGAEVTQQPSAHPEQKVCPSLLCGVAIVRPKQVWSMHMTYIRQARGFAYLIAIIDWCSRRVLSWRIRNSMEARGGVDSLEETLHAHASRKIFNSNQGAQFTSGAFSDVLKREGVVISRDGRGRAFGNFFVERLCRVKHKDVYLKGYTSMGELMGGLAAFAAFYNGERRYSPRGMPPPQT